MRRRSVAEASDPTLLGPGVNRRDPGTVGPRGKAGMFPFVTTSIAPSSSAGHGITTSQNVARDVMQRIESLRAATNRSRVSAYVWFIAPMALTAALAVTDAWPAAFITGYLGLLTMPIGVGVHTYRKRALKAAEALDRERDISWVSQKDGLIFFADDGLFIERRGGFKPYGVQTRRYTHVDVSDGKLCVHGRDQSTGATYAVDVNVPDGWSEDDTRRVQEKIANFP